MLDIHHEILLVNNIFSPTFLNKASMLYSTYQSFFLIVFSINICQLDLLTIIKLLDTSVVYFDLTLVFECVCSLICQKTGSNEHSSATGIDRNKDL